ncbi:MAG: hypothetical protein IPM48_06600 [Saprospiraceae bacterium]|nr:hypothetical protein [Saprospiraceae bacterium]
MEIFKNIRVGTLLNSNALAALILLAFGLAEAWYAMVNDGFYQGEEGAHYINMKEFWEDPAIILGNWAKTGWKIWFVLPALLGKKAVLALSILISVSTGWLVFLYAKTMNLRFPILVLFLLMCQTFWFSLSFRPICEPTAAFFLILAGLLHQRGRGFLAALAFSYSLTIRQELYIPGIIYGIYLLSQRKWKEGLLLGCFPLLYNLFGWWAKGDPFYLFTNAFKAADFANKYMRPGFDHYIQMAPLVFGWIAVLGCSSYLVWVLLRKIKPDWIILLPMVSYWLWECLSSMTSYPIGASTAGNLRYLLVISPLVAVTAGYAIDYAFDWKNRPAGWLTWGVILGLLIIYCTYPHNFLEYGRFKPHDWTLMIPGLLFFIFQWFHLKNQSWYAIIISSLCVASLAISQKPLKLANRDENSTCKEIADWCVKFGYHDSRTIYQSMPMFTYFIDRTPAQFPKGLHLITEKNLENAPVGSVVIWDSHYAANYGPVAYTWFESRPEKYVPKFQAVSPDQRVDFLIFEKIKQ